MADETISRQSNLIEAIQFMRQTLVGKHFIGHYAERRFVRKINNYRDLILLSSSEKQFKKDMEHIDQLLQQKYNLAPFIWFGLTCPNSFEAPNGHCLWVQFDNLPFGHYLFKIREVLYSSNEIIINIKKLSEATAARPNKTKNIINEKSSENSTSDFMETIPTDWNEYYLQIKKSTSENLLYFFANQLTLTNIIQVFKYAILITMSIILGGFEMIKFLGDFVIKLLRELSVLLKASTPIILAAMDCVTKVIGGLFILISMMWNGGRSPRGINEPHRYNQHGGGGIPYRSIKQ